jgi:hypothetical protein
MGRDAAKKSEAFRDLRSDAKPRPHLQFVSGDLRAGYAFHPPVRTPVDEIIPEVREPPENSSEFQALADFFLRIEKSP